MDRLNQLEQDPANVQVMTLEQYREYLAGKAKQVGVWSLIHLYCSLFYCILPYCYLPLLPNFVFCNDVWFVYVFEVKRGSEGI